MTQKFFNDLEALQLSIAIEERGEAFYRAAAKLAEDKDTADMLKELAEQEKEHADLFRRIYNELREKKENFDDDYIYDPEVATYLRAMVRSSVFPTDEKLHSILERLNGVADVLAIGIQAEKDSILFYTEMVINSVYVEAKDAFRRLIKEEKQHLIDLQLRLNDLKK
ncbi:MAG TPA: ferritin family protein [Candidatus Atribacteria bacterium]|nr:ferritin family protein [Candidatus Atribacteria bacterium]HPT78976.1 ferritin family protein [Candidatus Atribacteria bacterium]